MEITKSGETGSTIIYSTANDTIRSIRQVACLAIATESYKKCEHEDCKDLDECGIATPEQKEAKKAMLYNYVGAINEEALPVNATAYYSEKDNANC